MLIKKNYNTFIQSLRLVASSFDVQIASLPGFVNVPDEIALTYYDAFLLIPQLQDENAITLQALGTSTELNELFDKMSEDKSLWTIESLKEDKAWQASRERALQILIELNEPYHKPNLDFINWVN